MTRKRFFSVLISLSIVGCRTQEDMQFLILREAESGQWSLVCSGLILACGRDDIAVLVPSVGQQEPARQTEVISELQRPLRLPHIDEVSLGPAVCKSIIRPTETREATTPYSWPCWGGRSACPGGTSPGTSSSCTSERSWHNIIKHQTTRWPHSTPMIRT